MSGKIKKRGLFRREAQGNVVSAAVMETGGGDWSGSGGGQCRRAGPNRIQVWHTHPGRRSGDPPLLRYGN